jgi:hypothetical protein
MNLFIIGSGFTKALFPEAPLNGELLATLARGASRSASHKLIVRYKTEDIEIALTKLDADISSSRSHRKRDELQQIRCRVERELVQHFLSYRASNELLSATQWLNQLLDNAVHAGDSVISLNYDCVFEGALDCRGKWSPNGGYGSVFNNNPLVANNEIVRSPVTVLKIHGSTSFRISPYADKPSSLAMGFGVNEHLFPRSGKNKHFEFGLGKGQSYVIAPSYVKVPTVEITYLMLDALKAATKAKNLVTIGCGLRPEDAFLMILVTNFFRQPSWQQRKIIVVDPHARAITSRIQTYWGVKISTVAIEGRVEESVGQLLETIQL